MAIHGTICRARRHAESPPHRSRDPQVRSPVAAAVARVRPAAGESHPPTPGLLVSHSDSRPSIEPQAAHLPESSSGCVALPMLRRPERVWGHVVNPALGPCSSGRVRTGRISIRTCDNRVSRMHGTLLSRCSRAGQCGSEQARASTHAPRRNFGARLQRGAFQRQHHPGWARCSLARKGWRQGGHSSNTHAI